MRPTRYVIGGALAGLLVIGTAVVASAQSGGGTPVPAPGAPAQASATATPGARAQQHEEYLARLAGNLGVEVERLRAALRQTAEQAIDEAVAQGRIPAERAEELKRRAAEGGAFKFGFGHGQGKRGEFRDGPRLTGVPGGIPGMALNEVARIVGVDTPTLLSELRAGKTLAQIAQEHGKSREQVRSELLSAVGPLLDRLLDQPLTGPRGQMATPAPGR